MLQSPSHHVLLAAAGTGRVGVPAVLEVVAQNVAAVVLLLQPVGEGHGAVGLELLQRRVVQGDQVFFGAGQQLLLLVGVILGLVAERSSRLRWSERLLTAPPGRA